MAPPTMSHVHRLPIFDDAHNQTGNHALLQIAPAPGNIWPLQIEATEGESSYHTKVSRHELSSLREKKNQKSKDDWESIVLRCLLRITKEDGHNGTIQMKDLEVFVAISPQELSIVIRKTIGKVKQRLGEIPVPLDEEFEIDILSWCHQAVQRGDTLGTGQISLQSKIIDQQTTISDLNKRLEDLILAKKEHEAALMTKFCELINTKKLKIRDQQRLLATVKVDQAHAAQVRESRDRNTTKPPSRSIRKGKRKAAAFADDDSGEDDDEEGFGDANKVKAEAQLDSDEEEEGRKTDEGGNKDDDTTDDEDDDVGLTAISQPAVPHRARDEAQNNNADVTMDDLPPVRERPFGRNDAKEPSTATQATGSATLRQHEANDDDETTDDDEL